MISPIRNLFPHIHTPVAYISLHCVALDCIALQGIVRYGTARHTAASGSHIFSFDEHCRITLFENVSLPLAHFIAWSHIASYDVPFRRVALYCMRAHYTTLDDMIWDFIKWLSHKTQIILAIFLDGKAFILENELLVDILHSIWIRSHQNSWNIQIRLDSIRFDSAMTFTLTLRLTLTFVLTLTFIFILTLIFTSPMHHGLCYISHFHDCLTFSHIWSQLTLEIQCERWCIVSYHAVLCSVRLCCDSVKNINQILVQIQFQNI
jgi:hypothetical protein